MFSIHDNFINKRSFIYKFNQPFNQVVEFCTNIDIYKKVNFLGLIEKIETTNKKKFFELDCNTLFLWKKKIKIEFITINNYQNQGQFRFCMKIDKINSFKLPINVLFSINFLENIFDNSTLMIYEIGVDIPYPNNISNLTLNWIINNPLVIQKKEFIFINKLLEKYIYSCKREFSVYESILINKPVLEIWEVISNIPYLVNFILKIPLHTVKCQGEKGKVGSNAILFNLRTGYVINFRIKNTKINKDKIIVYFKKEINGQKAINNKFKIIITEMNKNMSLFQVEHNIPIIVLEMLLKF
jgi:hypothetical protein